MDEIAKLRAEISALRAEFSAHVVALEQAVIGHRSWLIACAACLLSGAVVAAMVH